MELLLTRAKSVTKSSNILKRLGSSDKTAVQDCLDTYGNLIWALAKKHTGSPEEAEAAASEIFLDVWQVAGYYDPDKFDEIDFIYLIARRRLIKNHQ